jgi:hypothetical protein
MRIRIVFLAILSTLALGVFGVTAATASNGTAHPPSVKSIPPIYKLPVAGAAKNGTKFTGTYKIQRFAVATLHGKHGVYSVGTVTGTMKGRHITRYNVMAPAHLTGPTGAPAQTSAATICPVLHLVLGPINLNLLGLQVTLGGGNIAPGTPATQPITLNLTAVQGGGLLGDLLCGVSNALNGSGLLGQLSGQLSQLAATLNGLVGLLGAA